MIDDFISISLNETNGNQINYIYRTNKSIALGYPCESDDCTPYIINLRRGTYFFECWGSIAQIWTEDNRDSTPGYGAYTSGKLFVPSRTKFYIYIGHSGFFNAVILNRQDASTIYAPGGATDIRLKDSTNWWDTESLISRIMVAAGGGSSEWAFSIGGDGGNIVGGESTSANNTLENITFEDKCSGATQTHGSICPNYNISINSTDATISPTPGTFGIAGIPTPYNYTSGWKDYGGIGGGGYYGGTSYGYAFAGSGGSSFISGHPGCNSVQNSTEIIHTNHSYHYSGFIFSNTTMIPGHKTMPLPTENIKGIYNGTGAFRITLLFINPVTMHTSIYIYLHHFFITPMLILSY